MTTGLAWDVENPQKPTADYDPDGERDIPLNWAPFLTDIGQSYASHEFVMSPELDVESSAVSGSVIRFRVKRKTGETLVRGGKYFVTCRITCGNGEKWDQTLYFKMKEF